MLVNHTGYLSTSCVSFFVSFPHLPHGLPPPPPLSSTPMASQGRGPGTGPPDEPGARATSPSLHPPSGLLPVWELPRRLRVRYL